MSTARFSDIAESIQPRLTADDDCEFWNAAVSQIMFDAEFLCTKRRKQPPIFAEIGCCSRWRAPNQARWTADGGFAWPSGYGGGGYSQGLPEFDWSLVWQWNELSRNWHQISRVMGSRPLVFRAALPARTAKNLQAAVHTIWRPGSPPDRKQKLVQLYGFRKEDDLWQHTATLTCRGSEEVYDV